MASKKFIDELNQQVAREFSASQAYLAAAVWYDTQTLPELASFFYTQAVEERSHALMMVKYIIDADETPAVPGIAAPRNDFGSVTEPLEMALQQEKTVSEQISNLVSIARAEDDYLSDQFMQWFLKEQVEEVSLMSTLLGVAKRAGDQALLIEDFLSRSTLRGGPEVGAPTPAGG